MREKTIVNFCDCFMAIFSILSGGIDSSNSLA